MRMRIFAIISLFCLARVSKSLTQSGWFSMLCSNFSLSVLDIGFGVGVRVVVLELILAALVGIAVPLAGGETTGVAGDDVVDVVDKDASACLLSSSFFS